MAKLYWTNEMRRWERRVTTDRNRGVYKMEEKERSKGKETRVIE